MITCPTCGAQNDPGNRFCDQCGSRLEVAAPAAAVATAAAPATPLPAADQPTAAATTCPTCGVAVLPGEAFCDECGAPLNQTALAAAPAAGSSAAAAPAVPTATYDAPTMLAPSQAPLPGAPVATASSVACPICGHQNLPGDHFCANCGADLTTAISPPPSLSSAAATTEDAVPPPPPPQRPMPVAQPDDATVIATPPAPAAPSPDVAAQTATAQQVPLVSEEPAPAIPASTPDDIPPPTPPAKPTPVPIEAAAVAAEPAVAPAEAPAEPVVAPAEPAVAPAEAPAAVALVSSEERQRLEGLVTAHRDTIAQYEQMIGRYPPSAAPAFLTAGLDEARRALAQAEADLAALPSGPDPAEVARLEGLVTAHRDTIAQYEQMIGRYPPGAAPAFLTAGLDEARRALAQAEADLAALHGGVAPVSAAVPTVEPATPAPVAEAVPTPVPVAPTLSVGPRLVLVDGGQELKLPTDRTEIIIGREDPVSSIFPEIDLTLYGGESGGVSRQHARITQNNGQWMVTDLNSTNYTRLDGNRLEPNTPAPLYDGARIQFGRVAVVFHL